MAKFVIECPNCGRYAEASSGVLGFFATKKMLYGMEKVAVMPITTRFESYGITTTFTGAYRAIFARNKNLYDKQK